MQRSILSYSGILVLGLIVLLINAVSGPLFSRFYVDLTQDGLYSLSQGTKNIVASLQTPVTIRAYVSKTETTKYPALKLYGDRVLSLLREYQRRSGGKISLEVFDPRPDSDEESWAQKYGIQPLAMPGGENVYFGLAAVNGRGDEEVIPVFSLSRQEFLEYDVTKALYSLNLESKPQIGIISSLKLEGEAPQQQMFAPAQGAAEPWVIVSQMSQFAEVKFLKEDVSSIDSNIHTLLIIHPKNIGEATLYAIDQFVMNGGNLFVAVDPYCNEDQPPMGGQDPSAAMSYDRSSNLKGLLSKWGVELAERKVVGDINLSTKVATSRDAAPDDFVLWVTLDGTNADGVSTINRDDMLTSQLNNVLLPWPGALTHTAVEGVTFTPLLQSTKDAMLFDEQDYRFGGGNPDSLIRKYVRGKESQVFAARITGKRKSNFTARPASAAVPQGSTADGHLNESKGDANVVVAADVDFLTDHASVISQSFLGHKMITALNDNLAFAGNITENLLGSSDLISLRSRGQFVRPFTRVRDIEKRAEEKWRMEETTLQATLNAANQRLSQIQAGTGDSQKGEKVLTNAVLEEVKKVRDQRAQAQQRLREVRRNLRQDKERLGQWLFVLNTFAVPLCLIGYVFFRYQRQKGGAAKLPA